MGADDIDPFSEIWAPPLHSQEALQEMAELLELVHYWRTQYEILRDEKQFRIARWRLAQKK